MRHVRQPDLDLGNAVRERFEDFQNFQRATLFAVFFAANFNSLHAEHGEARTRIVRGTQSHARIQQQTEAQKHAFKENGYNFIEARGLLLNGALH